MVFINQLIAGGAHLATSPAASGPKESPEGMEARAWPGRCF